MHILAIIGLVAFTVQFGMLIALRTSGNKEDPAAVTVAGLIAQLAFVALALVVLF